MGDCPSSQKRKSRSCIGFVGGVERERFQEKPLPFSKLFFLCRKTSIGP